MAGLNGIKEILLSADPGVGINPDPGYIYKWVEKVAANYIYFYKDETGTVGPIGTIGMAAEIFRWVLQAGNSNLPGSGTETSYSYGNNNANSGMTMLRDGEITGMTVRLGPDRTGGSANFIVTKNGVENDVAGQRLVIDGNVGVEGEASNVAGYIVFTVPFAYAVGDQIEVRAITAGWTPTSTDTTVGLMLEESLL